MIKFNNEEVKKGTKIIRINAFSKSKINVNSIIDMEASRSHLK